MGLLSFPKSGAQKHHDVNTSSSKRTSKRPGSNLENEKKSNEGKKGKDPFAIIMIPNGIQAISAPNLSCSFVEEVERRLVKNVAMLETRQRKNSDTYNPKNQLEISLHAFNEISKP